MQSWYAINSKPRCEKIVHRALVARGIGAYLPLWRQSGRRSRAMTPCPFFPGYLFANADLENIGLSALQYLPGVRHVVFRGDQPAPVLPAEIDEIQNRLREMEQRITDAEGEPLAHGDPVLITGGPLEGLKAVFDRRLSSDERVRLLIDFIQKRTPVEIERKWVEKKTLARIR